MIFCHIVDDYYLQGKLASMKQKSWWEKNAPDRLYKYDYLEEHPELTTKKERRHIPWEELIYEDRETLGPRKLKSFIFPWKDQEN